MILTIFTETKKLGKARIFLQYLVVLKGVIEQKSDIYIRVYVFFMSYIST